jgi:uncharacterized repeat protein (TIGR01451 family)
VKKLSLFGLLAVAALSSSAWAQVPPIIITTQPYVQLTGGTPVTFTARGSSADDEGWAQINLPFQFPYFGQNYSTIFLDTNGFLSVGQACSVGTFSSICYSNASFPNSALPNGVIAPFWDDMQTRSDTVVSYVTTLSEVTIEYRDLYRFASTTAKVTFQVKLTASGGIFFHHGPMADPSNSFTFSVGFEDQAGTVGADVISGCTSSCLGTGATSPHYVPNRLFTIGEPNEADLAVGAVTVSNFTRLPDDNLTFDVQAQLRNFGRTAASNFLWRAYLSRDLVLDTTATDGGADIQVFEGGPITLSGVNATDGGQALINVTGAAATTVAPPTGEYYVLVWVDPTNVVMEASESNNVGATSTAFVQGVDLVATSISGPTSTGGGNVENFPVNFFNRGTTSAGTVQFRILLSADQALDASDFVIFTGTRTVTGGQTINETIPVTIPVNAPNGRFYYLLQLDPMNAIVEANENNNVVASTVQVDVQRADLIAESIAFLDPVTGVETSTARFGEVARLRITFRNAGGANANNFKVAMVLSTDTSLSLLSDLYVCDETQTQVAPSATSTVVTLNCTLPVANAQMVPFATGPYFIFGILDATGTVFESNKANNSLMVGPIRIVAPGPDLAVTSITAPASGGVGELIPVVRTLKNLGNVDAPAVKYRFYASANDIITTEDVLLRIVSGGQEVDEGTITLARGATDTSTELVRLPGSMPPGTYFVGCIIDTGRLVTADLEPSNNALASAAMQVAPSSLRIVTTLLPDAVIGRPYSFRLGAVGEQGASTWRLDSGLGAPPSWLSIGSADGLLTGTPTGSAGSEIVGLTVVLENSGRQTVARLAMRVLPSTSSLEVTTSSIPAIVNTTAAQYQYQLGAAGGVRPYSWRVASGTLPQGIALGADGTLFGAPRNTPNGSTPVTFEVRDALGARARRQLALRLIAPGAITFRTLAIPDALLGQDYLQDIAVANQDGSPLARPLTWRVQGSLPAGLVATPQSELVTVAGRPTQAGTFVFSVSVEDNNGRTDTLEFSMTVHPPRYRVIASMPDLLRPDGSTVNIPLSVSPQNNAVSYRVVNGGLPPGLTLDPAGIIGGTIAESTEGTWSFIIEARDGAGMSGLTPFTLRVEREPRAAGCSATGGFFSPALGFAAMLVMALRRRRSAVVLTLGVACALAPGLARAQYQVVGPVPATYTPLTNGTSASAGTAITLPFTLPFFDTQATAVTMSQYGYLALGGSSSTTSSNQLIPYTGTSTTFPRALIAPWWDSLTSTTTAPATVLRYLVSGVAPNRIMAFEWSNVGANTTANRISFQVLLYETTGRIRFVYATSLPGTVSASVGVQKDYNIGVPGLSCGATCTSTQFPAGQALDFYLPPDLEITALSAPQVGYTGVAFPQTATVRNRGGREANNVAVRFYLSADATFDPMVDTVLGTATVTAIPAQASAQATLNAPLPANLTQSSYFVFAFVDPDNAIVEQSEANNRSAPSAVTIGAPKPDLVVSSFSAPTAAMPGASLQVTRAFQNLGNANSAPAKYTYFLSDNAVVSIADRSLLVGNLGALTPSQIDMNMESISLPADLAPGAYWLGVCVNYDAATSSFGANEITIVNNCFTQASSVAVTTGTVTIATAPLPAATQYAPYGVRLQATGGTGQYTWEFVSGALPPGITLSSAGDLVGSPSRAGSFSFDVRATSGAVSDTRTLNLTVMAGGLPLVIVDQVLPAAEFGRSYSAPLVALGGRPPYRWAVASGEELPPGLALAADGRLEGRPLAAGDFAFGVTVTDSENATVAKELGLRIVTPTSLAIATSAVEVAFVGRDYLQPLLAVGGKAPYAWSLVRFQQLQESITDAPGPVLNEAALEGKFPQDFGISIDDREATDYLSGTPRRAGLFSITLKVKDGEGTEDTASLLLRVTYRDGLAITTTRLPDAFVGQPYQVRLSHNGGSDAPGISFSEPCIQQAVRPGEFQCAASEPLLRLPVGLTLTSNGTILGTPLAETGTYTFLAKVTDAAGRQDVRALAIRLRPDFSNESSGCAATGLTPTLAALLALVTRRLRRRG